MSTPKYRSGQTIYPLPLTLQHVSGTFTIPYSTSLIRKRIMGHSVELLERIYQSDGQCFLNRDKLRKDALNLLLLNSHELTEVLHVISTPDECLPFMIDKNKESGNVLHSEAQRRLHNFLSAAKTLVDHTRVNISKHYSKTTLQKDYQDKINKSLASNPEVKFIHDLRNYMLHKGFPPTSMSAHFTPAPDSPPGTMAVKTAIVFKCSDLLKWDSWHKSSRQYIEAAGEGMPIENAMHDYLQTITNFHGWLSSALLNFHCEDLEELQSLQEKLGSEEIFPAEIKLTGTETDKHPKSKQNCHDGEDWLPDDLNKELSFLKENVTPLRLQEAHKNTFQSERPAVVLTDKEIIGQPIVRSFDENNCNIIVLRQKNSTTYGLNQHGINLLKSLTAKIHAINKVNSVLTQKSVEEIILEWLQTGMDNNSKSFFEYISTSLEKKIAFWSYYIPVANFEIEEEFSFGPVLVAPISPKFFEGIDKTGKGLDTESIQNKNMLLDKMRREMLGLASVSTTAIGDPKKVEEESHALLTDVVGLLRFYCPTAKRPNNYAPIAPLGEEYLPTTKQLILAENQFTYIEGLADNNLEQWQISAEDFKNDYAPKFDLLKQLLEKESSNNFAKNVKKGILLYSEGVTCTTHYSRLQHALLSVESILLKHSMEPTSFFVSERLGLLLGRDRVEQQEFASIIRRAYRLRLSTSRKQYIASDFEVYFRSVLLVYSTLEVALNNINHFSESHDFIMALDRKRLTPLITTE